MRRVLLLLLLAACEPPPDVEPLACLNDVPGEAVLGEGDLTTGWTPLEDGDPIQISFGPQGMHMIVVAVAVTDLEEPGAGGDGTQIRVAMDWAGDIVGGTVSTMQPSTLDGARQEFLGIRAVITEAEVDVLADELIDVAATVVDGCGREIEARRTLRFVQ